MKLLNKKTGEIMLIKDKKIRKAVRAWAEAYVINKDTKIKYKGDGKFEFGFGSIDFGTAWHHEFPKGEYTITELCGEKMKLELNNEQIQMLFDYDKTKSITIAVNLAKSLVKSYMLEELKEIND